MRRIKQKRHAAGFTLVEVLIVVVIIGLLAAIAIPNLSKARQMSRMDMCMSNLRLIEHGTDYAATELGIAAGATPTQASVDSYIKGGTPVCPGGGTYTYPAVGGAASCSLHGTVASPRQV